MSKCFLSLLILLTPSAAWGAPPAQSQPHASEPDNADAILEDIELLQLEVADVLVISAMRQEQNLNSVPYAISVISAEDIRQAGAQTVPEALRLAPGIDVAQLSSGVPAVSPRGFHGFYNSRAVVMVDGRMIFDSLFGGMGVSWPFRVEDIERIEVIRGPAGVTWGANAMNGVINIITKKPEDQQGLTVHGGGGSRGTHSEYLGYGFSDGKLQMRVSGQYDKTDGYLKGGSLLKALEDEHEAGQFSLYTIYQKSERDTLTLSAGSRVVGRWAPPAPSTLFGATDSKGNFNHVLGKWEHQVEKNNRFQLIGYLNDVQLTTSLPAVDYRFQQMALQFNHSFEPADNHTLTWGIDTRTDLLDGTLADPFMLDKSHVNSFILGLYAQDRWQFAPQWSLTLGGRIDYDSYGGFEPSGRLSLDYELDDNTIVWAAVSHAYQMPPAAIRFADIPILTPLVRVDVNHRIDAATMQAYELGIRRRCFDCLQTSASLYAHDYENLFAFQPTVGPPGLLNINTDNRAAATTYGAELEARWKVNDQLTLQGHYTFEKLHWDSPVDYTLGTDLVSPPAHKFMLASLYDLTEDTHLSAHLYFVDEVTAPNATNPLSHRAIDSYFRLDLRAEQEFWDDRGYVAVGVSNLLDDHHAEGGTIFLNNAEVPRMIYAEMRIVFNNIK